MSWTTVRCFGCMQREQSERAHAAAEVLAAKHEAAAWQARLQQQAADMANSIQQSPRGQVTPMHKHVPQFTYTSNSKERLDLEAECYLAGSAAVLSEATQSWLVVLTDHVVCVDSSRACSDYGG